MEKFRLNDVVRLIFRTRVAATGTLTAPTSITLSVRLPDGTTSSPSLTNDATGKYSVSVTLTKAGIWGFSVHATGAVQKSEEFSIEVLASDYGLD